MMQFFQANFGTFSRTNVISDPEVDNNRELWQGEVVQIDQEPIQPHAYQIHLETEETNRVISADTNPVRYWSDYNRVFYIPRTVQMLPDVPDWQMTEGNWALGQETFERYNEDAELMDGPVRLFLEECDSFQGLQLTADSSTFASFSCSFLLAFHEELSKAACLSFPLMGDGAPRSLNLENTMHTRKVFNDAVYLRELDSMSLLTIPIMNPKAWTQEDLGMNLKIDNSHYHTSSILSAHMESATFPLRSKAVHEDMNVFARYLNAHGTHRFSQIRGLFPVPSSLLSPLRPSHNMSVPQEYMAGATCYAQRDVTRGLSVHALHAYDLWRLKTPLKEPLIISTHSPAYPLPSSFPDVFCDEMILSNYRKTALRRGENVQVPSTAMFTSMTTNSGTGGMFGDYAKFTQACIDKRRIGILPGIVDSLDDMKELVNDLWTMHDGYAEYTTNESDSGEL